MKVVVTEHHYTDIGGALAMLRGAGVEVTVGDCRDEQDATDLARDADAVINQHLAVTAPMLASWPRCRAVAHFGKGVDNIDVAAASREGIWVTNVRDANWDEVSNHVLALLLAWTRALLPLDRDMRRGGFDYRLATPRHRLAGQVLGLIGFGDIARTLAAKARALGLRVVAHARRPIDDPLVERLPLADVLRLADFVSLHVPLTAETAGLIGARELALMKPTSFLINTSRGGVVNQPALVAALQSRRIAGAGLDVTTPEPLPPGHPLLALDNVILTPHVAWYSEESREHVTCEAARDVLRVLRGERPLSAVNPDIQPRFRVHV